MQLIIQRQKLINTDKLSLWLYNRKSLRTQRNQVCDYTLDYTTAKAYQHWQTEFVIIQRWLCNWLYNGKSLSTLTSWVCDSSRQPQKSTNTEKSSLWLYTWLYNGKSLSTLSLWLYNGDYAIDCKTAKGYQHWQTDYTTAKVYEHRPNQVCNYTIEYTTGKGYQHWQTAIVIVQRQKSTNTENWVCHYKTAKVYQHWQTEFFYYITAKVYEHRETKFGNKQRKTLPTLTNQVCDYITAKIYQYWPGADPGFSDGGFGQTSAYIILLLLNKPFFHNKK